MQLFYNTNLDDTTSSFSFPKEESKHIMKVLRKSVGDKLNITNGKGWLFVAEITFLTPNKCSAVITERHPQKARDYKLHLAVAPTKMNDRYEWFLEKATEIGIDSITPIICDHSERKIVKSDRFNRILQSAMKQSLHHYLPKLYPAVAFNTFINELRVNDQCFIAHCETLDKKSLKHQLQPKTEVTILIGPEGDFSTKEIEAALNRGITPVSLGTTRLRTETAAIVACHSVAFTNES